ncbi:MAG TPA: Holliday junction resolvase RuvX [Phycisphaerae bacterium]|nr:Holliday junction resolvase RuvX [Phycisphaerae bacterium]
MSRWIGIDHGTKRIGLAAGDTAGGIATPLDVIPAEPLDQAIRKILQRAEEYHATGIVVGWPLNMDDTEGPQGKLVREVAAKIESATGLDVRLWDERLSSFQADQALAGKLTRKKKKARQDAVAAAAILQDFLSCGGPEGAPKPNEIAPA